MYVVSSDDIDASCKGGCCGWVQIGLAGLRKFGNSPGVASDPICARSSSNLRCFWPAALTELL